MRLIDADALLAQLEYLLKTSEDDAKYSGCREAAVTWNDAIYAIKIAPTIEPEQRWIPVTERLPEEDDYKSCIECLDGAVWYFTENGTMGLGYYYKSVKEWSTTDDLKTDGKVIAWMPLPKPWRGEEHGHTMEEFMYGQDMGNPEDGSL